MRAFRLLLLPALALSLPGPASGQTAPSAALAPKKFSQLPPAEQQRILVAAGYRKEGGVWKGCDGMTEVMTEDVVEGGDVRDLNADGKAEVIVGSSGTACYGMTGMGYAILTPTATGWKVIDSGPGIPHPMATRGTGKWQDIQVGGPGFCFPVLRWNGEAYVLNRHEYEGKPCKPPAF